MPCGRQLGPLLSSVCIPPLSPTSAAAWWWQRSCRQVMPACLPARPPACPPASQPARSVPHPTPPHPTPPHPTPPRHPQRHHPTHLRGRPPPPLPAQAGDPLSPRGQRRPPPAQLRGWRWQGSGVPWGSTEPRGPKAPPSQPGKPRWARRATCGGGGGQRRVGWAGVRSAAGRVHRQAGRLLGRQSGTHATRCAPVWRHVEDRLQHVPIPVVDNGGASFRLSVVGAEEQAKGHSL